MADTLEFDEMPIADDASLALNDMEKKQIIHALEQAKGNRKLAAALLGIYFIQCIYCLSATCKTNRKKSRPLDCRLPDSFMCAHFNPSVTT
ncbi:helix-turn-helix domain-containing protein [Phocaeicola barnesiae]|uniref:helix-turn-helix domain-containing protein n=1 Tax=Phocaeicola barnesiae TaxID=376804 RepID=UPI0025A459FE|nr:helix-turn-helix domain-containing protein [Phocaeicola barnesiae]MDM8232879.1 helix-turn-helix domain-containing protein [Phocaeicola barnesiae]